MLIKVQLINFPTWIWNKGKGFPQDNPVGPDIRLAGKDFIRQGLDGHRLD
jgi:hypothetical protein